jgi:hypothetical protein
VKRAALIAVAACAISGCLGTPEAAAPSGIDARQAFANLAGLAGDWQATTPKGAVVRASYRVVAGGSAVVETWTTPSGGETVTVFHRDGAGVVATHYCAQGNQPRLRLASGEPTRLHFEFWDATNLAPGASHLVRLDLARRDPEHYDKTEIYAEGSREESTTFAFVRAHAAAP